MKLIKNILVPVDFRDTTENLVYNAIALSKKFNCKITLFHVLPKNIENEKIDSLIRKAADEELEKLKDQITKENIDVESVIDFGDYSDRIAFAANKTDASLILISAGEKESKDSIQLGTTAGKVIKKSHKPVFVVKRDQKLDDIQTILCPVDFSQESSNALNNAIAMTRLFDAKLIVMSVYAKFATNNIVRFSPDEVNAQRKKEQQVELDGFIEKHNTTNLNFTTEIVGGDPARQILKALKKHKVDLLFIGTTGKSGISKILLGSVAEKVTREVLTSFVTSKKVDFLNFEIQAQDLEEYYQAAEHLYDKNFYEQAIGMYEAALEINLMHVPSIRGLAKAYKQIGDEEKANKYRDMVKGVMEQFENFKIEEEIRNSAGK